MMSFATNLAGQMKKNNSNKEGKKSNMENWILTTYWNDEEIKLEVVANFLFLCLIVLMLDFWPDELNYCEQNLTQRDANDESDRNENITCFNNTYEREIFGYDEINIYMYAYTVYTERSRNPKTKRNNQQKAKNKTEKWWWWWCCGWYLPKTAKN